MQAGAGTQSPFALAAYTQGLHKELLPGFSKDWEVPVEILCAGDFPGGAVVKNPPANAGDMGSSPGLGSSHMPKSN